MEQSILDSNKSLGILSRQSLIQQKSSVRKSSLLGFSLNLTTLIDAFCILVIFLLSNMSTQTANIDVAKNIKLPEATQSAILESGITIQIQPNEVIIDQHKLLPSAVAAYLIQLKSGGTKDKKYDSVIIQADKSSNFEDVGAVLRSVSQAGISKIVFAAWPSTK